MGNFFKVIDIWIWHSIEIQHHTNLGYSPEQQLFAPFFYPNNATSCLYFFVARSILMSIMVAAAVYNMSFWLPIKVNYIEYSQYFTYWSMWLSLFYFLFAFILMIVKKAWRIQPPSKQLEQTWISRIGTLAFHIAYTSEIIVTLIYWAILYNPNPKDTDPKDTEIPQNPELSSLANCTVHVVPILLLTIDWVLNRIQHPDRFSIHFISFMIAYAIQSYVAQVINGEPLYFITDWNTWIAPVAMIGVLVLALVAYYSLFGLSILKHKLIHPKLKQPEQVEQIENQ